MLKTVSTQLALASDTLSEILAKGNTSGSNNIAMDAGYGIGQSDGQANIDFPGSDVIVASTAGIDRLTVAADGNIGIANSGPAYKLSVGGVYSSVNTDLISITDTATVYRGTPDGTGHEHAKILSGRDASSFTYGSYLGFYTEGKNSGSTDTSVERMRLAANGNLSLASGNVVLASGKGIDFSATAGTGTSELLDDYEEGTWTPSIAPAAGAITSYTATGKYTKIGQQVTISGYIKINDNGTGASYITVSGLPFVIGADGGSGSVRSSGLGGHIISIQAPNGASTFTMWKYDNTYPVGTNSTLNYSFSYFV